MRTILITGATSGLGLALARALDAVDDVELVLGVRNLDAARRVAATLRREPKVVELDVASVSSIRRFTSTWTTPLFALVNNAGVQLLGPTQLTEHGVETTLAVNHLGPLQLTLGLLPRLEGGRVLGIGSGTHNPNHRFARLAGFRGGRWSSIAALARGEMDAASDAQRGKDRYATSKLVSMVAAMELARRHPKVAFATLDPGMMPGTGLARANPWYLRFAWRAVLPWLVPLLDDASSPARSAAAARRLLLELPLESGEVYDFTARPSTRVWPEARSPELGRRVVDESLALLDQVGAAAA
ncbi:MAG: SDR family NAD(P)-dependent oxidoreductase [Myxococcales bacterium]